MNEKSKSLKSAFIALAVSKYSNVIINLIFTMILARVLSPEDYGIVAVANVFINFFIIFSDMGISAGIIQNKTLSEEDIYDIYSFTIRLGIALGIMFVLFSFPMSYFYADSRYIFILSLLAVSLSVSTFNMVPNAIIMKDKMFNMAASRTIIGTLLAGIVTLILAVIGLKYYAIVISNIFHSTFIFLWNKRYVKIAFHKKTGRNGLKKIFTFSSYQFAYNFVNYFSRNLDNLLTGKFIGGIELGYYDKAYNLTQYPISAFSNVITPALHPFLSEQQNDKEYIFKKYIEIQELFISIGIFITTYLYFFSSEVVMVMFGNQWENSVPCLKWLGISLWAQLAISCIPAIFQSIGDTKHLFIISVCNACITALCVIVGILQRDIIKLSIFVAISYILHFFIYNILLFRLFDKNLNKKNILFLVRMIFCICILLLVGKKLNFKLENIFVQFIAKTLTYFLSYILLIIISGEFKVILKILGLNRMEKIYEKK